MNKVRIILKNGRDIIVENITVKQILEATKDEQISTQIVSFLNFETGTMVCLQEIAAIEDIKENDDN